MTRVTTRRYVSVIAAISASFISAQNRPSRSGGGAGVGANPVELQNLPSSSQQITPTAPRDSRFEPLNSGVTDLPEYVAGQAVTPAVCPDHNTLLVLTSGYNLIEAMSGPNPSNNISADSTEFVFAYNISNGSPAKTQSPAVARRSGPDDTEVPNDAG